jgi:hypothetical protein
MYTAVVSGFNAFLGLGDGIGKTTFFQQIWYALYCAKRHLLFQSHRQRLTAGVAWSIATPCGIPFRLFTLICKIIHTPLSRTHGRMGIA